MDFAVENSNHEISSKSCVKLSHANLTWDDKVTLANMGKPTFLYMLMEKHASMKP